jgi:hypothetical protein
MYHTPVKLPFWGEWTVTQAHNGEYTHKEEYRHAWDFVITDREGKQFRNQGNVLTDYYCYDKAIVAPADGIVTDILDGIPDNPVGKENLVNNWGNTVVIKHSEALYSKISHLKEHSIKVEKGNHVKAGDILGICGNSGRSPYPHLHFQLQSTPYIGSKTLEYPVSHYLDNRNGELSVHNFDFPLKNDRVANVSNNKLLTKAFEFTAGQVIDVTIKTGQTTQKARWEVITDIYNQSYLWEKETRSAAYYVNDGTLFQFTHFEGSRKSKLYIAYCAMYEVLLAGYNNLVMKSEFPANQIFAVLSIAAHDFVASFKNFIQATYTLKYKVEETTLAAESITLIPVVKTKIMGKERVQKQFEIHVSEKGIEEIEIKY